MAIQNSAVVFQYELDKLVQVYENDKDLKDLLIAEELYYDDLEEDVSNPLRIKLYENILSLFSNNSLEISNKIITDLLEVTTIRSQIDSFFSAFAKGAINDNVYRQLLFSFKYGTIKSFFKTNYEYFMPSYDSSVIKNNEKMKIWQEAFMQEFDRFAQIIDNIKDINDIDTVSEKYLDYVAQLVGFERGDTNLGDSLFREITKNIIEVYRIKGTNYSFELFFNFIGFEINVIEYWFDKRYYFTDNLFNPYTKETKRNKFSFYLTPHKPTDAIPENMFTPFIVMGNELTDIRNGLTFDNNLTLASSEEVERYLDINGTPDTDMNYTYFKTNVIEYSISKITDSDTPEGLTKEDEATIQSYTNFLTPIFVSKKVVINITPFEDDASSVLTMTDSNNGSESMFMSNILGMILIKLGLDKNTDEETELWGLEYLDKITSHYIQELNIWNTGNTDWDDFKDLQSIPMYNDTEEFLKEYNLSYPYIENKPNKELDFTIESTADNLLIDEEFFNDTVKMSVQSTHYSSSGGISISGESNNRTV